MTRPALILLALALTACQPAREPLVIDKTTPCLLPASLRQSCRTDAAGNPAEPVPPPGPPTDSGTAALLIDLSEWGNKCATRLDSVVSYVVDQCAGDQ